MADRQPAKMLCPARGTLVAPPGVTLAAALRASLPDRSWSQLRALCASGKILVDGARAVDPARRLAGGESVTWNLNAPDPRRTEMRPGFRVVHEDAHLVVIEKPEGVSTAPFEPKEVGTALDLVRGAWRAQGRRATVSPLYVVHRLDKETSGLLCVAKTKLGERGLHQVFKNHRANRTYIAVAHGQVQAGRIESRLLPDRGDGIRGSMRPRGHGDQRGRSDEGQHAITHVEVIERLREATVCRVRLETGRTHQIRIHLAERGHPVVGEPVYIRDFTRSGTKPLRSRRLLLHAATLAFEHPVSGERLSFECEPPPTFVAELERLRRQARAETP